MVQTMTRRIFPIDDWAPAQEARYDGGPTAGMAADTHRIAPPAQQPRARGLSLSFPWRHRPQSSVFGVEDLLTRFPDLAVEPGSGNGGRSAGPDAETQEGGRQGPKGRRHIKGMIRQASVSLKGIMPHRASLQGSGSSPGQKSQSRRLLRSSHAHSQSLAAPPSSPDQTSSSARPTTSHSTWRRLRQAASFRHSRVLYGGQHLGLDTMRSPSLLHDDELFPAVPSVPMPGPGNGPPIIPPNTGGAARAAAAAFQSEIVQSKLLYPDEYYNDVESGIGIAVTSAESDLADLSDAELGFGHHGDFQDDRLGISKVDFVAHLPAELAISILAHLDAAGLAVAARVSKGWNTVVMNQHVWREAFLREKTHTYATSTALRPGAGQGIPRVRPGTDWRMVYKVKQDLDRQWQKGKARPVYLNGHSDSIYCLQFDEYVSFPPPRICKLFVLTRVSKLPGRR